MMGVRIREQNGEIVIKSVRISSSGLLVVCLNVKNCEGWGSGGVGGSFLSCEGAYS